MGLNWNCIICNYSDLLNNSDDQPRMKSSGPSLGLAPTAPLALKLGWESESPFLPRVITIQKA